MIRHTPVSHADADTVLIHPSLTNVGIVTQIMRVFLNCGLESSIVAPELVSAAIEPSFRPWPAWRRSRGDEVVIPANRSTRARATNATI